VQVHLQFLDTTVCLEICDDGVGFDPPLVQDRGGLGLRGMKERVEKISGAIQIASEPGRGTRVTVHVPLNAAESAEEKEPESLAGAER
jgi:signal transduction histidine kinase